MSTKMPTGEELPRELVMANLAKHLPDKIYYVVWKNRIRKVRLIEPHATVEDMDTGDQFVVEFNQLHESKGDLARSDDDKA